MVHPAHAAFTAALGLQAALSDRTFVMLMYGGVLAILAIAVGWLIAKVLLSSDAPLRFESHWGGLGGGLGGWHMSRPLGYLITAAILASLAVITAGKAANTFFPPPVAGAQPADTSARSRAGGAGGARGAGSGVSGVISPDSLRKLAEQTTTSN